MLDILKARQQVPAKSVLGGSMEYPKHLERHKRVYERRTYGETYVAIAQEMGITPPRARDLAKRWKRELSRIEKKRAGVCLWCGNPINRA